MLFVVCKFLKSFRQKIKSFLIIWMSHSQKLKRKIDRIHVIVLRKAYKDYQSSIQILLVNFNFFVIYYRYLSNIVTEIFKVKNDLAHPHFMTHKFRTAKNSIGTQSFLGPNFWVLVPNNELINHYYRNF